MPRKANPNKVPVVRSIHLKTADGLACGRVSDKVQTTEVLEEVTCKRCLKVLAAPKKEVVEGAAEPKAKRARKTKGADASAAPKRTERRACDWGKDYIRKKYNLEEDENGKLFRRMPDGFKLEYRIVD